MQMEFYPVEPEVSFGRQGNGERRAHKEVGLACDHARIACNMIKRRYDKVYGVYETQLYERLRMQQYVLDKHYNRKHGKNAYYGQEKK